MAGYELDFVSNDVDGADIDSGDDVVCSCKMDSVKLNESSRCWPNCNNLLPKRCACCGGKSIKRVRHIPLVMLDFPIVAAFELPLRFRQFLTLRRLSLFQFPTEIHVSVAELAVSIAPRCP